MANQFAEADSQLWDPPRSRQNAATAANANAPRGDHRITDPRLIHAARRANGRLKRALDFFAALGGLIFLLPAFATIAILIKIFDNGPVFYAHARLGRHGRIFKCLKFRSMRVDAQERLAALLLSDPAVAAEWRESQKLKNDPRVTKLGHFLRKSSLDELPQLWNVLKGDMSLVGPRPITRAELERYGRDRRYYLLVRPGITGLWQVSGRSNTNYERRVRFDKQYVERWSFVGDLNILVKTVPAVLDTDATS